MAIDVVRLVHVEPLFQADVTDPLGLWLGAAALTGDASGGLATIELTLPQDFILTVLAISARSSESATVRNFFMQLQLGKTTGGVAETYDTAVAGLLLAGGVQAALFPNVNIGPFRPDGGASAPGVFLQTLNTLNEVTSLRARGFLFDKSLFAKVSPSLWSRFIPS